MKLCIDGLYEIWLPDQRDTCVCVCEINLNIIYLIVTDHTWKLANMFD